MSDTVIRGDGLGKRYRVGQYERYRVLREVLTESVVQRVRRARSANGRAPAAEQGAASEYVWALRDASFEVKAGEVLGIVGPNGAGKSTLLKLLARITRPTEGRAEIHGRVGSLLEVGTGFHRELTGRENIYLNGAILGMKKADIDLRFDEIVEFAEVERFIDTPVKRYSSGMYMRLGFSVAAHLEPDILIVDEVLAVGDAQFQKKCLGVLGSSATRYGRTVLFVSHNMHAVQQLCSRCLLVEAGKITLTGRTSDVISAYLAGIEHATTPNTWISLADRQRTGDGQARFVSARYSSHNPHTNDHPYSSGSLEIVVTIESDEARTVSDLSVFVSDRHGAKLVNAESRHLNQVVELDQGRNVVRLTMRHLYLNPGLYSVGLSLANHKRLVYDHIDQAFELEVVNHDSWWAGTDPGVDGAVFCEYEIENCDDIARDARAGRSDAEIRH
jgi:lipopolysaccharide transport system ATP-binding protein